MKIIFLFCWFIIVCSILGQFLNYSELPFPSAAPVTTVSYTDPSGANALYAWWVASDLTANSLVGDTNPWIDRIQGVLLRQATANTYPTNESNGLRFNDFQWLSNSVVSPGTNSTLSVIIHPTAFTTQNGDMCIYTSSANFVNSLGVSLSANKFTFYTSGYNDFGSTVILSNSYDVTLVQSNSTMYCYTNGDFAATISVTPPSDTGYQWRRLAFDSTADGKFTGWIREVLIWSNNLSSAQVSNVHTYRTNLYGP